MLESEDDVELRRYGGYYYDCYCEGVIQADVDIITRVFNDDDPNDDTRSKIIHKLPADFAAEVKRLLKKFAGLSGDRRADAMLRESEYLLDLTANMNAYRGDDVVSNH